MLRFTTSSRIYHTLARLAPSLIVSLLLAGLLPAPLVAQTGDGSPPVSFTVNPAAIVPFPAFGLRAPAGVLETPPIDREALLAEDEKTAGLPVPYRFGVPVEGAWGLENAGSWDSLPDGGRLWRLQIRCPEASSINLVFDQFRLPPGARLWVFDTAGSTVWGGFTAAHNRPHGKFATGLLPGDSCMVEYYEPAAVAGEGRIRIERVIHGYRDVFQKGLKGFGQSGSCNVNVNCPEGQDWTLEARSVAVILVNGGGSLCSGSLINNVRRDGTPYFLTADHCLGGDLDTWVALFNYQSSGCSNEDGPRTDAVVGMMLRANRELSDFALLELSRVPPASFNVYYAGWSAESADPPSTTGIHHPRGDIKKICFDDDPVVSSSYRGGAGEPKSHWKVVDWDVGTTEPGSSGSPLFDQNHRVIGQLTGGEAACGNDLSDYYGKVSMSWDAGLSRGARLRDWLDPDNTGVLVLDGLDPSDTPPSVTITNPADAATVTGVVRIAVSVSDEAGR